MTQDNKRISYGGRRLLALMKGEENNDDFGNPQFLTIYCVSRDLVIECTENNLNWWLKNADR